jgi:hypothetical protein
VLLTGRAFRVIGTEPTREGGAKNPPALALPGDASLFSRAACEELRGETADHRTADP